MIDVAWLIPRLVDGSGGIRTMLQHAKALENAGFLCHIYIEGSGLDYKACEEIKKRFGYSFTHVTFGWEKIKPAKLVIATIWYSAAIVKNLSFDCIKIYLIQDYEPYFNPIGYSYLMAENSYRYGLIPITVGRWMQNILYEKYNSFAFSMDFGIDEGTYYPVSNQSRERAICFIHQPDKSRRCSRLGIDALGIVNHYDPSIKIYLYGSNIKDKSIWFQCSNLGLLSLSECNALYNRCSLGLCLSASNPSRIPFEMMGAGLPVVELWRENCLYDFSPSCVSLSEPTPESIAANILQLFDDNNKLLNMSNAAIKDSRHRIENNESNQFIKIIHTILNNNTHNQNFATKLYNCSPITAEGTRYPLPYELRDRIYRPSNARLNKLHPILRNFLSWSANKARAYLLD